MPNPHPSVYQPGSLAPAPKGQAGGPLGLPRRSWAGRDGLVSAVPLVALVALVATIVGLVLLVLVLALAVAVLLARLAMAFPLITLRIVMLGGRGRGRAAIVLVLALVVLVLALVALVGLLGFLLLLVAIVLVLALVVVVALLVPGGLAGLGRDIIRLGGLVSTRGVGQPHHVAHGPPGRGDPATNLGAGPAHPGQQQERRRHRPQKLLPQHVPTSLRQAGYLGGVRARGPWFC